MIFRYGLRSIAIGLFWFLTFVSAASAKVAVEDTLKLNVQHFSLANGMLFLVVERPTTPQVACRIAIRAGSALEPAGRSGIAHLLEHMLFKGTKNIGTLDPVKDQQLQDKIEAAYQEIRLEESRRKPDKQKIERLHQTMKQLREEVRSIYIPQAFSSQLGRNGAVGVNAFTSKDQTQYTASVPADMLEQWFSIISEQLFEPSWREFYVEKEVIQREWAFRYINNPSGAAWLDLNTTAYSAHPYRNPVIGWLSDMQHLSTADAIDFHTRYYRPSNAVCVLVGDLTVDQAKMLAETYFSRYPAGMPAPEKVTAEPAQQGPRHAVRYLKGARTPQIRIGFHGAPMGSRDFYALDALIMVLSHGRSARMTQQIINQGRAASAWVGNPDNRYGSMVILGGSPNEPDWGGGDLSEEEKHQRYVKACESLEKMLLDQVAVLREQLVSPHELKRIKKMNRRDFIDRLRSNEEMAGTLATLEVQVGWRYLNSYLEQMAQVTAQDIQRVARKYFDAQRRSTIFVLPGGAPDQPPAFYREKRSLGTTAAAKIKQPEIGPNRSDYATPAGWQHPLSFHRQPKKVDYPPARQLKVGATPVFYLPDRQLPLVDMTLLFKAGQVDLDADQFGIGQMISAALIRGGTQHKNPRQLARYLDENAIQLAVSVGEEASAVHLSILKDDWQAGMDVLAEILLEPAFDAEVLDATRNQLLTAIRRQGEDAQTVAFREAEIWQFQGHPYGRDPLSALQTIPQLTVEDLKAFLKRYLVPRNMVVAVAGDISAQAVTDGLHRFIQKFPDTRVPARKLAPPAPRPAVLTLIHKPGQVQSQVSLTLPGMVRSHPDYWKNALLMNIFGGGDSLMYTRLRDDLGLVYSAGFFQGYKWQAGYLRGYIGCKADATAQAIDETAKVMARLHTQVPESQFRLKKLDVLNGFVFNVDTANELVSTYARYHLRDEPLDTLDWIQQQFITAQRDQLRQLAQKVLIPQQLQIFVVGDKNTPVHVPGDEGSTLEDSLKALAARMGLPYREQALR